ncbi:folate-binding protein YgfZ [Wenzhouxiangella sp. AB-CW3]|uniref:CAF17-like 4Fe-4S cluster assembly/insertion protein YgfZ n=1 Tax=Wenzhouxiangella sp. AB-CW3 TaxID=2771012 RepID=UPI00168BC9F4|nr:folate-binding protein YgfZ [Wenzhouxiangella sp. AB-CW3]QOC21102.1 folate-binding protein YgfZ [Wenzhouxiangella sp. AB-CW3]
MSEGFRLDHLAVATLSGPDALAFAQSQFTLDFDHVGEESWHPCAWCDPKGKALIVMLASCRESDIDLVLPKSQAELLSTRLPLYAIGRTVNIAVSEHAPGGWNAPSAHARPLSWDEQRSLEPATATLPIDGTASSVWQRADLDQRIPWLSGQTSARHLPQSLGLEALDGLSFSKGCYPGQEVIARVHYLGKVRYRTSLIDFGGNPLPEPAETLRDPEGQRVGELLWGLQQDGNARGLAVLTVDCDAGQTVVSDGGSSSGQVLP